MSTSSQPLATLSPGWSLALGVLLVVAGIMALVYPVVASITAALYIGWFALIAGVIAIVVAGFLLVTNPVAGAASLALLVGALMVASGVVELMLAFRMKPRAGWGWLLANGVLSIVLAIMIAVGWPMGSLVLIGYLVGFQIITCGIARIALSMAAKKIAPTVAT